MEIKLLNIVFLLRNYNIKKYTDDELLKLSLKYLSELLKINNYEMDEDDSIENISYKFSPVNEELVALSFEDSISLFKINLESINIKSFDLDEVISSFFSDIKKYQNAYVNLALKSKLEKEEEKKKEEEIEEEKRKEELVNIDSLTVFNNYDRVRIDLMISQLNQLGHKEKKECFQSIIYLFEESVRSDSEHMKSFRKSLLFYLEHIKLSDNDYFVNWLVNIESKGNDSFTERIINNFPLEGSSKLIHYYKTKMEKGMNN